MKTVKAELIAFRDALAAKYAGAEQEKPRGARHRVPAGYDIPPLRVTPAYIAGIVASRESDLEALFSERDTICRELEPVCKLSPTAESYFCEGFKFGRTSKCTDRHFAYAYNTLPSVLNYTGGRTFRPDEDIYQCMFWQRRRVADCRREGSECLPWLTTLPTDMIKLDPDCCSRYKTTHWVHAIDRSVILKDKADGMEHVQRLAYKGVLLVAMLGSPHLIKCVWEQARRLQLCLMFPKEKFMPMVLRRI